MYSEMMVFRSKVLRTWRAALSGTVATHRAFVKPSASEALVPIGIVAEARRQEVDENADLGRQVAVRRIDH